MDTARDMWAYLLGRYERQGPEEEQLFLGKLITAQQGTLSIAQYFDQIQSLRLKYLAREGTVTEEQTVLISFRGLDPPYAVTVTHWNGHIAGQQTVL